jgi:hypothetical protein
MLVACCILTSSISAKASISQSSLIHGRLWVDGGGAISSPDRESCWLTLPCGIGRMIFGA